MAITPTPDDLARERHVMSSQLLTLHEQITPIYDAADGIRADLTQRGYSPTAAEQVVTVWLCEMMKQAFNPG